MINNEKREFFRIEDHLSIKWRFISQEEFKELENTVRFSSAKAADELKEVQLFKENRIREQKENEQLFSYLQIIDKKLDMILDYLSESMDNKGHYITRYLKVDISGSGISFVSDVEMKMDDYIELKIILPAYPHLKITALCRVARSQLRRKDNKELWEIALNYLVINDKDRDLLINYIFMKEREILRYKYESTG